ncbi:MAG: tyrosine-type recombinase/integrase [Holophagaceae bacterium]
MARWFDKETGKALQKRLGDADDYLEPDGIRILDFHAAQKSAEAWFREVNKAAHFEATGELVASGPYTVASAMADYLRDAEKRGVKGHSIMTTTINAHIIPTLGGIAVAKLTKKRIEDWLQALAESPRRKTGKARDEVEHLADPVSEDEKRARRDSANRVLTNLNAALNLAVNSGRYYGPTPWREVKRFKGVGSARVHFLNIQEQRRLVRACPDGFKELVQAALYTGCRYGELCRLKVRDFNTTAKTVFIEKSKSGKTRHIALTEEAAAWFVERGAGRGAGESLLIKPNAKGKARKYQEDPLAWGPHDQKKLMIDACIAAKVEAMGFHELRHTYASGLVNKGVPLAYVAAQLGHTDTTMVEKYYGHLCPSALADSIRKLAPVLKISKPKVKVLRTGMKGA